MGELGFPVETNLDERAGHLSCCLVIIGPKIEIVITGFYKLTISFLPSQTIVDDPGVFEYLSEIKTVVSILLT